MARLARFYIKDQPQHIIQRGNNRIDIFRQENDYVFYLKCLSEAAQQHKLKIHAYVLMTNHVHLLASPLEEISIPKTLQSLGRRYVQYFNRQYERSGTLWEGRYKATLIDSEQYLFTCMRYIELNPVRARNMVKHPRNYQWSSYHANVTGAEDALVTPHRLYRSLGHDKRARCEAYKSLFKHRINNNDLDVIRNASNKAWMLGSDKFKKRMEKLSARRADPLTRGRHRNQFESDPN